MELGWKKKVERLSMTMLSAGHQMAKELSPGIVRILDLFGRAARSKDGSRLMEEIDAIPDDVETKPLWEPIEIYGWKIQTTMYLQNGQLWWLLTARRRDEKEPRDKDIAILDKVIEHLGADPERDMIIGPRSSPPGEPRLPFGWWTWFNRMPLYEVQVKGKGQSATLRVVPLGTRASDGYTSLDLTSGEN